MTWYAIYVIATGALVSVGTRIGTLPPEYGYVVLPERPEFMTQRWNPATLAFEARPADPPNAITVGAVFAGTDTGKCLVKILQELGVTVNVG